MASRLHEVHRRVRPAAGRGPEKTDGSTGEERAIPNSPAHSSGTPATTGTGGGQRPTRESPRKHSRRVRIRGLHRDLSQLRLRLPAGPPAAAGAIDSAERGESPGTNHGSYDSPPSSPLTMR